MRLVLLFLIITSHYSLLGQRDLRFRFDRNLTPKSLIAERNYDSLNIISKNKLTSEEKRHTSVYFNSDGETTKVIVPQRTGETFKLFHYEYDSLTKSLIYEYEGIPSMETFHVYENLDSIKVLRELSIKSFPKSRHKIHYHLPNSEKVVEYDGEYKTVAKYNRGRISVIYKYHSGKPIEQKLYKYYQDGLIESIKHINGERTEVLKYNPEGLLVSKIIIPPKRKAQESTIKEGELEVAIEKVEKEKEIPIYNKLYVQSDTLVLEQNYAMITPKIQTIVKIAGHEQLPYWFQSKVGQSNGFSRKSYDYFGNLTFDYDLNYEYDEDGLPVNVSSNKYELTFIYY